MSRILLSLCLLLTPALACAADAPPAPAAREVIIPAPLPGDVQAEQKSVQAWGRDNPDCVEWSDGCVVCTKEACSTPGIACTPRETACRRK